MIPFLVDIIFFLVLRAVAEGRIGWAFWPPDTDPKEIKSCGSPEQGIWIPRSDRADDESDSESEHGDRSSSHETDSEESEDGEEDEAESSDEEEVAAKLAGAGRFGALSLNDGEDDDSGESSEVSSG